MLIFTIINPFRFFFFRFFNPKIKELHVQGPNAVFKVYYSENFVYKINRMDNPFSLKYHYKISKMDKAFFISKLKESSLSDNILFPIKFYFFGGYVSRFIRDDISKLKLEDLRRYLNLKEKLIENATNFYNSFNFLCGDWNKQNLMFDGKNLINVDFEGFITYNSIENKEATIDFISKIL